VLFGHRKLRVPDQGAIAEHPHVIRHLLRHPFAP
jgi:hypothetical protein